MRFGSQGNDLNWSNSWRFRSCVLFSCSTLLICGFLTYLVWMFYSRRKYFGFRDRRVTITVAASVGFVCFVGSRGIGVWFDLLHTWDKPRLASQILLFFYSIFAYGGVLVASSMLVTRLWLILYSINLTMAQGDSAWIYLVTEPISLQQSSLDRAFRMFVKRARTSTALVTSTLSLNHSGVGGSSNSSIHSDGRQQSKKNDHPKSRDQPRPLELPGRSSSKKGHSSKKRSVDTAEFVKNHTKMRRFSQRSSAPMSLRMISKTESSPMEFVAERPQIITKSSTTPEILDLDRDERRKNKRKRGTSKSEVFRTKSRKNSDMVTLKDVISMAVIPSSIAEGAEEIDLAAGADTSPPSTTLKTVLSAPQKKSERPLTAKVAEPVALEAKAASEPSPKTISIEDVASQLDLFAPSSVLVEVDMPSPIMMKDINNTITNSSTMNSSTVMNGRVIRSASEAAVVGQISSMNTTEDMYASVEELKQEERELEEADPSSVAAELKSPTFTTRLSSSERGGGLSSSGKISSSQNSTPNVTKLKDSSQSISQPAMSESVFDKSSSNLDESAVFSQSTVDFKNQIDRLQQEFDGTIDPMEVRRDTVTVTSTYEWYARNKASYGNASYLLLRASLLCTFVWILSAVVLLTPEVPNEMVEYLFAVWNTLVILIIVYIAKSYPTFHDSLQIYEELRIFAVLGPPAIVIALCSTFVSISKGSGFGNPEYFWRQLAEHCFFASFGVMFNVVQTGYVIWIFPIPADARNKRRSGMGFGNGSINTMDEQSYPYFRRSTLTPKEAVATLTSAVNASLKNRSEASSGPETPTGAAIGSGNGVAGLFTRSNSALNLNGGVPSKPRISSGGNTSASNIVFSVVRKWRNARQISVPGDGLTLADIVNPDGTMMQIDEDGHELTNHQILCIVLRDETGFRAFMQHLFKEFSYESLLCVFEMLQFRSEMKKRTIMVNESKHKAIPMDRKASGFGGASQSSSSVIRAVATDSSPEQPKEHARQKSEALSMNDQDIDEERESYFERVRFPMTIEREVKSSIVFHRTLSWEQKFLALVDKYVSESAEMTINLGYYLRKQLLSLADTIVADYVSHAHFQLRTVTHSTIEVKHTVFDRAINALLTLLNDSLARFKETEDFTVLVEKIHSNQVI